MVADLMNVAFERHELLVELSCSPRRPHFASRARVPDAHIVYFADSERLKVRREGARVFVRFEGRV
jgi:hypothetical protein